MWTSWRIKVCDFLWTAVVVGCERYCVVLRFKAIIVRYVWMSCDGDHSWRLVCFGRCQCYGGTWCLGFRIQMVEDGRRRLLWNVGVYLRNNTVQCSKKQSSAVVSPDLKFSQRWWRFQSWGTGRRRWKQQALPKHWYLSAKLHGIRSCKP